MSLSRLEKEAVQAEEARVTTLREKARADTVDERKLRKKVEAEVREHTRFCVKGACQPFQPAELLRETLPLTCPPVCLPTRLPAAALEDNIWWYKDRAGLSRGPLQLTTLRACWVQGVVDEATLVWGQGLEAWYPVRNVVGLVANIQSLDGAQIAPQRYAPASPASPPSHLLQVPLRPHLPEAAPGTRAAAAQGGAQGAQERRGDADGGAAGADQGCASLHPCPLRACAHPRPTAEGSALKIDELSAPHPALRAYFAEKAKQVDDPAPAAPRRTPAAACLTLALPLAGWQQARE